MAPVRLLLLALAASLALPQLRPPSLDRDREHRRLPDGKSQTEAILKADFEQSLKDAAELYRLAEELKIDLEKNDRHILSLATLKKTEEIEKLAKKIRSRMKRY